MSALYESSSMFLHNFRVRTWWKARRRSGRPNPTATFEQHTCRAFRQIFRDFLVNRAGIHCLMRLYTFSKGKYACVQRQEVTECETGRWFVWGCNDGKDKPRERVNNSACHEMSAAASFRLCDMPESCSLHWWIVRNSSASQTHRQAFNFYWWIAISYQGDIDFLADVHHIVHCTFQHFRADTVHRDLLKPLRLPFFLSFFWLSNNKLFSSCRWDGWDWKMGKPIQHRQGVQ